MKKKKDKKKKNNQINNLYYNNIYNFYLKKCFEIKIFYTIIIK